MSQMALKCQKQSFSSHERSLKAALSEFGTNEAALTKFAWTEAALIEPDSSDLALAGQAQLHSCLGI